MVYNRINKLLKSYALISFKTQKQSNNFCRLISMKNANRLKNEWV
jgi:hypothetical protein